MLGTKNYTAPAYLSGQPGSTRSDLFSMGVIAYETQFIQHGKALLLERNPLVFWKVATAAALSGHLLWLYFWAA